MTFAPILAQGFQFPESGAEWVIWIVIAAVIVGLWLVIRSTRQKAYRDYWERQRRAKDQRLNDPDMAKPETPEPTDTGDGLG